MTLGTIGAQDAWAKSGKGKGNVQIGFTGAPQSDFQDVLLNVQSIRINPSQTAGPGDRKWQTIPVPPGNGQGAAGRPGDLQIDLNSNQNVPVLFNTAQVRVDTYQSAEILLDQTNPGSLVPRCASAGALEGCITYPFQLSNTGSPLIVVGSNLVAPPKQGLATLVLQVQLTVVQAPTTTTNGFYVVDLALTPVNNQQTIATVSGTVNNSQSNKNKRKVRKLAVNAELAGTNTVVASAPVLNGSYVLNLPAGPNTNPASPFGVLYDLAVSGGSNSYDAIRLPPLFAGVAQTPTLSIAPGQQLGNITGKVTDGCSGLGISGATLQLLIPPDGNPSADCTLGQCVSVATANTDNTGKFPLPGTVLAPAPFNNVPILTANSPRQTYTMMVTAPGYDTLYTQANATKSAKGGTCTPSNAAGTCDLTLTTGFIVGSIPIVPPLPGQTTLVQVFAEDAGTNNIQNALPMPVIIRNPSNAVTFMMNVPTLVPTFDLFATTIDLFQGVSDPYQGHSIAVASNIAGPGGACAVANADLPLSQTIACVGHGSISGSVANANLGTSVVLSKVDPQNPDPLTNRVKITNTAVQNLTPNQNPTNAYSFCEPADTYEVQRFQLAPEATASAPIATPTPVADGLAQSVMIPTPVAIPSPTASPSPGAVTCPTICSNPDGSCPGTCVNAQQNL